jgi:hypothetical protein
MLACVVRHSPDQNYPAAKMQEPGRPAKRKTTRMDLSPYFEFQDPKSM